MAKEKTAKKYEIDMVTGPLLGKILIFAIPLVLSGILQLLFNAADIVVVGQFVGNQALAAVGSTGALINLLINLFMGLSIGTNVLVARSYGAGKKDELDEVVHTSILTALLSGTFLVIVGLLLARPALEIMGTPEDVIDEAAVYMRIYFIGMPSTMAYNFGSAVLRAVGDTKRPLYFLTVSGVVNVILNLIFVIVFRMSVSGVALATIISQTLSAFLVLRCLMLTDSDYKLVLSRLRIVPDKFFKMLSIGLPAGLQGTLFSLSNVLIQSSVNSFGSVAMAGNTAASNVEGFVYTSMNSIYQTSISFTGQNHGAMKVKRIGKILLMCQTIVILIGLVMGNAMYFFGSDILKLYSSDPQVIEYGLRRMSIIATTYFLCGMMDVIVGSLRGMGYSIMPMLVSLAGACGFRILWIYTVFQECHTLQCLYISYPISWALTFSVHFVCFLVVYGRLQKRIPETA